MEYFTSSKSQSVSSDRSIYTPSSFAKSSLLHLQETGKLTALAPHTSSRANLPSYLFFTVLSGEGQLLYDGKKYMLSKGSCVFIDCLPAYSHVTSDNLWKLGWVHFNGPEMGNIYEKYKSRGGLVCFQSQKNYSQILDSLYAVSKSSSHVRDMEINSLLSQLLVYLMEDSWNPENKENRGKRSKVVAVKQYIDENFSKHITLDELSSLFFMNKTYLSEMFKEQYGVPVNDYLISVRTTEAKKLLRFTAMTMEEIAEAIGVNGAAYFSRMFKKVEGCSPSEYRAMW